MIVQAAQTVRQNKRTCRRIALRAEMIGELLHRLRGSDVMRHHETRRPLQGLEGTLRRAHRFVVSCRGSGAAYRFLMGGKQASRFREVEDEIDSYLLLVPLVNAAARPAAAKFTAADQPCSSQDSGEADLLSITNRFISEARVLNWRGSCTSSAWKAIVAISCFTHFPGY